MSVVTITGDPALVSREITDRTSRYLAEHGALSVERIQGEETDIESVISAVGSVSFLNPEKLVIIDGISLNKNVSEKINQVIEAAAEPVEVVLLERQLDKRSRIYKDLKSLTVFKDLAPPKGSALQNHIGSFAQNIGISITRPDTQYLIAVAGEDVVRLESELTKLAAYGQADRKSIDLLVDKQLQSKVFDLLEAAMNKNSVQTLDLYAEQRMQKVEPQAILGLIVWQLHILLLAKLSKNIDATARSAKVSEYPLSKAKDLVRAVSYDALKVLVEETARTDLDIKKGADADDAVRLLLLILAK